MRTRRILAATAMAMAVPATAIAVSPGAAQAAQQQVCAYGNRCLNAYSSTAVRVYTPGVSHEDFYWQQLGGACGGTGYVQANCPFVLNYGLNDDLLGGQVGQVVYAPTGQCVGSSGGTADFTGCNKPSTGTGGGTGTVDVDYGSELINRTTTNAATVSAGVAVIAGLVPSGGDGSVILTGSAALPDWAGL